MPPAPRPMQFLWPVLLALAARPGLHAQAPDIQWQRCLGGSSGEMGYRLQKISFAPGNRFTSSVIRCRVASSMGSKRNR